MGLENILVDAQKIKIEDKVYELKFTLYSHKYLASVYGTAPKAEAVLKEEIDYVQELISKNENANISEIRDSFFETILEFLRAGIEGSRYDKKTCEVINEVPSAKEMLFYFSPFEIFTFIMPVVLSARGLSLPKIENKDGAKETENFQKMI